MGETVVGSVLVIDDDAVFAEGLARDFLRHGAQTVRIAPSVTNAVALAAQAPPDLATVDLCLGRLRGLESGFDLIPELKKIVPSIRICVVTDYYSAAGVYRTILRLGADALLSKPTTAAAILNEMRESPEPVSHPVFRYASLDTAVREHIMRTLINCGGNKTLAAKLLQINLRTLQRKLKKNPPL